MPSISQLNQLGCFFCSKDIIDKELQAIREGFVDADPRENKCTCCQGRGCHRCCPLITCLVAQGGGGSRQNIRVVPAEMSGNVPSGTCVDSDALLLPQSAETKRREGELLRERDGMVAGNGLHVFESATAHSSDFYLVPQGGIKGTSNGVLYRVILNENAIFAKDSTATPLTKPILQQLMYAMSFIYGKDIWVLRIFNQSSVP